MKKELDVIRTFPDSILKVKTKNVTEITESIINALDDMLNVIHLADGAGLAANQIGIAKSLAVALMDDKKFIKLINPTIKEMKGEEIEEEGCLSVPHVRIEVRRAKELVVEYLDIKGKEKILEVKGFPARVLQHEILIIEHLPPEEKLKFLREYKK